MEQEELVENSAKASRLLRVMSNEKRLIILCNLVKGELSVQQLQERTGFGQSTVSQQLATLRAERIVSHRREAQSVFYGLNSEEAGQILQTLYGIFCADKE